jgi:hypothetical protein
VLPGESDGVHVRTQKAAHRCPDLSRDPRGRGYYFVDKTGFALRLDAEGKSYFLSRPRRFGKSLFLYTLAELCAGNEALFAGLEAEHRWD